MMFHEAMKALEEGKKVRMLSWPSTSYISNTENTTGLQGCLLISNGWNKIWEIYEEPQKTYTFMEVVKGLKEGKSFRRKIWIGIYIKYWETDIKQDWNGGIIFISNDGFVNHLGFELDDFESDDWIEVQE